jgi:hypothetical protein
MQQRPRRTAAVKHNRLVAIVDRVAYEGQQQFTWVQHDEPDDPQDSGFALLGDEALELLPDNIPDERLITVCLHCLIDQHPDVGKGLDVARQTGKAIRDDDDWLSLDEYYGVDE